MDNSKEVVNDFSIYYNNSISESLENIRELKKMMLDNPNHVKEINLELSEIFIKIRAKLITFKQNKKVDRMKIIDEKLRALKPLIMDKGYDRLANEQLFKIKPGKDYGRFKYLLHKKEILIWDSLESLGMTGKLKENKRMIG